MTGVYVISIESFTLMTICNQGDNMTRGRMVCVWLLTSVDFPPEHLVYGPASNSIYVNHVCGIRIMINDNI